MEIYRKKTASEKRTDADLAKMKSDVRLNIEENEQSLQIVSLIRERYSINDENAILRKAIAAISGGQSVSQEYLDFNAYVEECKAKVRNQQ